MYPFSLTPWPSRLFGDPWLLCVLLLLLLFLLEAATADDLGVDISEDVGQDVANVGQEHQHDRDSHHGIADTEDPTPHSRRGNMPVA